MAYKDNEKEKEAHRQWRKKHPDYMSKYFIKNREKLLKDNFEYRQLHPKKYADFSIEQRNHINHKRKERYTINKEKILARNARYQKNNPLKILQNARSRRLRNPEKIKDNIRRFYERNPTKQSEYTERKRANKSGSFLNDFTGQLWNIMKDAYKHCCAYCNKPCKRLTQDHIIPLSDGGSHTAANIVPACQSCNSIKHTKRWWDCQYACL